MPLSHRPGKRLLLSHSDDDEDSPPPPPPRRGHTSSPTIILPAPMAASSTTTATAADEEEDDYMSMVISDPTPLRETLTQRTLRLQREAEARGRPKSKAELARQEKEKREAALQKSLIDAEAERSNKGLRMMKMMGFTPGKGLGRGDGDGKGKEWKRGDAVLEPIGVAVKEDRAGIGHAAEMKRKLEEEAGAAGGRTTKRVDVDPEDFRDRVRVEREEMRFQAQFYAAQKVAEKLDMARDYGVEEVDIGKAREIPMRSINVLWRGLVKHREEKERERRMRHDMEQGLAQPRLPGYHRMHELDEVDRVALGVKPGLLGERGKIFEEDGGGGDGPEDEDEELDAFEELPFEQKLDRIVRHLRDVHKYCFWCKWQYDDDEMDGCPGTDEASHG